MSQSKAPPAAVFLDRDGTLVHETANYVTRVEDLHLIDGIGQALRRLRAAGYLLVVVTNQACLAKGLLDEQTLKKIHDRLESLLGEEAVQLDGIHFCGDYTEGTVEKYIKDSPRRKPQPGMLLEAADQLGIDLSKSWMVGDATRDVQAGSSAGCRTVLLTDPEQIEKGGNAPADITAADFTAHDLSEAADIIIAEDIGPAESAKPSTKQTPSPSPVQDENVRLLADILRELRHQRVAHRHREFSVSKMMAGMLQCTVFLCLVFAYVAFSHWSATSLFVSLAIAMIFQTMVVALLLVHRSS